VVWRLGKKEIICLSLHCHHQNDPCIKIGSDESHFNVSFIVRDKVTRQCPQTTTFLKRKESRSGFELKSFCLPAYRLITTRPNRLTHRYLSSGDMYIIIGSIRRRPERTWTSIYTSPWTVTFLGSRSDGWVVTVGSDLFETFVCLTLSWWTVRTFSLSWSCSHSRT